MHAMRSARPTVEAREFRRFAIREIVVVPNCNLRKRNVLVRPFHVNLEHSRFYSLLPGPLCTTKYPGTTRHATCVDEISCAPPLSRLFPFRDPPIAS